MKEALFILVFFMMCCYNSQGQNSDQFKNTWQLIEVAQISKGGSRSINDPTAFRLELKSRNRLRGIIHSAEEPGWYWGKYRFRKDGTVKKIKAISDYPYQIKDIQKKWDVDLYLIRLSSVNAYTLTEDGLLVLYFQDGKFSDYKVGKGKLVYRKVK